MDEINTTTRTFPRTLEQAFPHEPDNSYTIYVTKATPKVDGIVYLACAFASGFILAMLVYGG